jgi:release factor H-coupled RctB family protein
MKNNMRRYFTDKSMIETNAKEALDLFTSEDNIHGISIFPDIHYCSEKNLPVGVAFETIDVFYPLITGKDLGCGVAFSRINKKDYLKPFNKAEHYRAFDKESYKMTDEGLGGGNHFLSLEEDEENLYIICHTGSRNLGIYLYQKMLSMLQNYSGGKTNYLPVEMATEEFQVEYNKILNYASERRQQFINRTAEFLIRNKYLNPGTKIEFNDSIHNHIRFGENSIIHRKGSTELRGDSEVVIPLSMTRGSLIVKANIWDPMTKHSLFSCSHGAGRKLSRTDTMKFWRSSLKESERKTYKDKFVELLDRSGEFSNGYIQEFDFAYKNSKDILTSQPYLIKTAETKPIVTVKFTEI